MRPGRGLVYEVVDDRGTVRHSTGDKAEALAVLDGRFGWRLRARPASHSA